MNIKQQDTLTKARAAELRDRMKDLYLESDGGASLHFFDPRQLNNWLARVRRVAREVEDKIDITDHTPNSDLQAIVMYADIIEVRTGRKIWQNQNPMII